MKKQKLALGIALAIVVAIISFFIIYSDNRGIGTYVSKSYSGCYQQPDELHPILIVVAQPGEELRVKHVAKTGWATIEYQEYDTLYTNFFGLTPKDVSYPIKATTFYDGRESLLVLSQALLWLIFCLGGLLITAIFKDWNKASKIIAIMLVALEIAYTISSLIYKIPPDILLGMAFDSPLSVVLAFLTNMVGLAALLFAHTKLIKLAYAETKEVNSSEIKKVISWTLIVFIILFTIYITLMLIALTLILIFVLAALAAVFVLVNFMFEYERSHVRLTKDATGNWSDGSTDYEVNEARGTAKKKNFFDLLT